MGGVSSTPAVPSDDVILEVLLRVPPEPIYLLRASLVCRKWRDLIRDPAFLHEFRARHRQAAPLVGFFYPDGRFVPTGEPPDRVAAAHLSQPHGAGRRWRVFGSRHGRVLVATTEPERELELLVWDPMTGGRSYFLPPRHVQLEYPAAGGRTYFRRIPHPLVEPPCLRGALVCDHDGDGDAGGCCHSRPFYVFLLFPCSGTMFASVYYSRTGAWSDVTAANGWWSSISHWEPNSVLVGNELYWPEARVEYRRASQNSSPRRVEIPHHSSKVFGYNFNTNWLQHVKGLGIPPGDPYDCLQVFKDEYGELGLAAVRGSRLHLFEPVVADDYEDTDTATWSEYREIDLGAILPPPNPMSSSSSAPPAKKKTPVGFHEDGNTIYLETWNGVSGLQLQSLKVNKILDAGVLRPYRNVEKSSLIPYMSFFVGGDVGGMANEGAAQQ